MVVKVGINGFGMSFSYYTRYSGPTSFHLRCHCVMLR